VCKGDEGNFGNSTEVPLLSCHWRGAKVKYLSQTGENKRDQKSRSGEMKKKRAALPKGRKGFTRSEKSTLACVKGTRALLEKKGRFFAGSLSLCERRETQRRWGGLLEKKGKRGIRFIQGERSFPFLGGRKTGREKKKKRKGLWIRRVLLGVKS